MGRELVGRDPGGLGGRPQIEDLAPGKFISPNKDDDDAPGLANTEDYDNPDEEDFVPMVQEIKMVPEWLPKHGNIPMNFIRYDESLVRVWTKPGNVPRDRGPCYWEKTRIGDWVPPQGGMGDLVPSVPYRENPIRIYRFTGTITLYVEALRPSLAPEDIHIVLGHALGGYFVQLVKGSDPVRFTARPKAEVDLLADVNDDGRIDDAGNQREDQEPGLVLGVNNNDSDGDRRVDWADAEVNGPDDLDDMRRLRIILKPPQEDGVVRLSTAGNQHVRIFDRERQAVIGPEGGQSHDIAARDVPEEGLDFYMEGISGGQVVVLEARLLIRDSEVCRDTLTVSVWGARAERGFRVGSLLPIKAVNLPDEEGRPTNHSLAGSPRVGDVHPAVVLLDVRATMPAETAGALLRGDLSLIEQGTNHKATCLADEAGVKGSGHFKQIVELLGQRWLKTPDALKPELFPLGEQPTADSAYSWMLDILNIAADERKHFWLASPFTAVGTKVYRMKAGADTPDREHPPLEISLAEVWFLDNKNEPVSPDDEALNVSNWVTTFGLRRNSAFHQNTGNPSKEDPQGLGDPDNFRIQVHDPTQDAREVNVVLRVVRKPGVAGPPTPTIGYMLNKREGNRFRGEFLRLVSDSDDDRASEDDPTNDPGNQTVLVQLGDAVELTYRRLPAAPDGRGGDFSASLPVGRHEAYDNNDPAETNQRRHDIRTLKVRVVVFRRPDGSGPVLPKRDVQADLDTLKERLAQATIRLQVVRIDDGDGLGLPLPPVKGIDWADGFRPSHGMRITNQSITPQEQALFSLADGDPNSIDVFYVERIGVVRPGGTIEWEKAWNYAACRNATDDPRVSNNVVVSAQRRFLLSLAHEVMHLLLNVGGHRRPEPRTALFYGTSALWEWQGFLKPVDGPKRIGPFADEDLGTFRRGWDKGAQDTSAIRANVEGLPKP